MNFYTKESLIHNSGDLGQKEVSVCLDLYYHSLNFSEIFYEVRSSEMKKSNVFRFLKKIVIPQGVKIG